ncbi:alginate lyase [Vibrio rumoiensis 1S-45]|uniref:Alginate lyase n=1 Tax=Vibrio rumoiensis 1S-45 TaxID=1188252 RepID=A0A1E5E404_9VIBR|nr:alginate lyase [Vibrio rumoiensis 1S-45]
MSAPVAATANNASLSPQLDVTKAPTENFDLSKWKINLPYPDDKPGREGKTMELSKEQLNNQVPAFSNPDWFFTDPKTGAMVFRVPNQAVTTPNSKNARTELRAMLADGYDSPDNNFVVAAHDNASDYGAIGGHLSATLSVDWVSTSGNDKKSGAHAVVIGQIHGSNNEPLKIVYRKLPNHEYGSLSWNYETNPTNKSDRTDIKHNVFGQNKLSKSDDAPQDGVRLGEVFSYDVNVEGNVMHLTFKKNIGEPNEVVKNFDIDLSKPYPGQSKDTSYAQDWMYFKAGAYNQCNTGSSQCSNNGVDAGDYTQVSFYKLTLNQ